MDKEEGKKPKQVLWLEEQLGFELVKVKTEKKLRISLTDPVRRMTHKEYVINENEEVIALNLHDCFISDISFLSELKGLTTLDLGYNQLSDISFLSELKGLTSLYLRDNQISDISVLPKKITSLDLRNNQISDISVLPKKITSLDLCNNQISDISFLSELRGLTSLNLHSNQISDISFLSELRELTSLNLHYNQISDISFLSELRELTSLNLDYNQISDISFLSELRELTSLNLSSNSISDISFLSELKGLTSLNLYSNKISDISLSDLPVLTSLDFRFNQISDISLSDLPVLTSLGLRRNQISNISLSDLPALTSLDLSSNQISDISSLFGLKGLTSLNLSVNQISDISFLSGLKGLTSLNLSDNQLSDISFLSDLKNLISLNLTWNKISDKIQIRQIVSIENLKYLNLQNNPITYFPMEAGSLSDIKALRNYFQNQDFVPNKEIKVVILGNGMVGKSTLLNRFLSSEGKWEDIKIAISDRTEGIVIKENIDFELEDDKEIKLNIWDFGGQEVYHGTHRLFLNKDAVYIIVWALETDEQKEEIRQNLNYWLDYVQDLAVDSPVILVHSQVDKESENNPKEINKQLKISAESEYQENIIEHHLKFSAKTGEGLNNLKNAIKKAIKTKLSARVETEIPKKWSLLRDDLRKLRENEKDKINQISKEDYQIICDKYKINESEAETVLLFLHRTGFLYYYQRLSESIILNQTWAIEAIYEALKPKSIAKDRNGILKYEKLKDFWIAKNYTETEVKTFIDFMVSSEICFCKEQQYYQSLENPTFIIPHYLPEPANSFVRWRYENSFYLKYKPAFFHKGIAERFLSRLGRLSNDNDLWRNGIRIFSETLKAEALITFDKCKTDEKQKEVFIRSENYELLEAIIKELNKILDEGSQTKPSEKVTFFYSLDGKEFVEKKKLMTQIEDDNQFVRTVNNKKVEVKYFAEKYRLGKTQKTVSKESDFEKEGKQNETLLMKEANNKKNPITMNENQINLTVQKALKHLENANNNVNSGLKELIIS